MANTRSSRHMRFVVIVLGVSLIAAGCRSDGPAPFWWRAVGEKVRELGLPIGKERSFVMIQFLLRGTEGAGRTQSEFQEQVFLVLHPHLGDHRVVGYAERTYANGRKVYSRLDGWAYASNRGDYAEILRFRGLRHMLSDAGMTLYATSAHCEMDIATDTWVVQARGR